MTKFVYFIRPIGKLGPVKIGCSAVPKIRLKNLNANHPFELEIAVQIPGAFDLEKNIHDCFAHLHLRREWFMESAEITTVINKLLDGLSIDDALDLSCTRGDVKKQSRDMSFVTDDLREYRSYMTRLSWARSKIGWINVPHEISHSIMDWRCVGRPRQEVLDQANEFFDSLKKKRGRRLSA